VSRTATRRYRVDTDRRRSEREATFAEILRTNLWGNVESVSGPGSTRERASAVREDLVALFRALGVRVLLDAPCGDFHWTSALGLELDRYIGIDIVEMLVAENLRKHAAPGRSFLVRDLISDPLPRADLVLCRDALVHFPHAEVRAALDNFKRSGSTWLLTTHFAGDRPNDDISLGDWRPLNLRHPPFNLPPPIHEIDERLTGEASHWADKRLALWRLGELPAFE
jgi:hypothetical protein